MGRLQAPDRWRLRVGDILPKLPSAGEPQPFVESTPLGEVCLRLSGTKPWTCTPATQIPASLSSRLEVTTDELAHRGIDVLIRDASWTPIHRHVGGRFGVRLPKGELPDAAVLCQGLTLGRMRGPVQGLLLYLDDP